MYLMLREHTICRVTAFRRWCRQLNLTQRHSLLRNWTRYFRSNNVVICNLWCAQVCNFPSLCSGVVRPVKVGQLPRVSSRLPRVWLADSWQGLKLCVLEHKVCSRNWQVCSTILRNWAQCVVGFLNQMTFLHSFEMLPYDTSLSFLRLSKCQQYGPVECWQVFSTW